MSAYSHKRTFDTASNLAFPPINYDPLAPRCQRWGSSTHSQEPTCSPMMSVTAKVRPSDGPYGLSRPPNYVRVIHASFRYQAAKWSKVPRFRAVFVVRTPCISLSRACFRQACVAFERSNVTRIVTLRIAFHGISLPAVQRSGLLAVSFDGSFTRRR